MYIPLGFMGSQGSCLYTTTTSISGSGVITSGSFWSGSTIWDWNKFEVSSGNEFITSFNILTGSTYRTNVIVIAGGGGGAQSVYDGTGGYGAAGGGGAGGVIRYTQFPLQSGSYQIVVGNGGNAGVSSIGSNGYSSSIRLPIGTWPPFDTQYITAYGGGGGGWAYPSTGGTVVVGGVGASAGGNAQKYSGPAIPSGSIIGIGGGGLDQSNQGNQSAGIPTSIGSGNTSNARNATGGGGAGTSSPLADPGTNNYASAGGAGVQVSITGSAPFYVAGGGGGNAQHTVGANGSGQNSYGGGGRAGDTHGGGAGPYYDPQAGNAGMVYIEWPRCYEQNCNTYTIASAGAAATATYYPCNSNTLVTYSLDANTSTTICSSNVNGYPTISGGGSSITLVGSCYGNNIIPAPLSLPLYLFDATLSSSYSGSNQFLVNQGTLGTSWKLSIASSLVSASTNCAYINGESIPFESLYTKLNGVDTNYSLPTTASFVYCIKSDSVGNNFNFYGQGPDANGVLFNGNPGLQFCSHSATYIQTSPSNTIGQFLTSGSFQTVVIKRIRNRIELLSSQDNFTQVYVPASSQSNLYTELGQTYAILAGGKYNIKKISLYQADLTQAQLQGLNCPNC
jgi:hypothetical protein